MNLYEYQNKRILKEHHIPVLAGNIAYTPQEAIRIAHEIGGSCWSISAQVHKNGKISGYFAGAEEHNSSGIQKANSLEEVQEIAAFMIGKTFITPDMPTGQIVTRVYVEEICSIQKEMVVSVRVDIPTQRVVFCIKSNGKIKQYELLRAKPPLLFWYRLVHSLGLSGTQNAKVLMLLRQMYQLFITYDALAVELNPFGFTQSGHLKVLDGQIIFDQEALFRYPEIAALNDFCSSQEQELLAEQYNFRYQQFSGNIACLVNGSGLGAATVDLIETMGGRPACLLDVGTTPTKESVAQAFKQALSEPNVEGIFVNIFGGITRCDIIAEGLIAASGEISVGMPLVVRMDGTNAQIGTRLLFESRRPFVVLKDLDEAVASIIQKVEVLL